MTKRLYYDDAYLTRFEARIVEQIPHEDRFAVVLDQTAFYPTSGGQPFDVGSLGDTSVLDVLVRERDDAVLHIVAAPLPDPGEQILGEIEWGRRFDHMQQHTGQHILSQAFVQIAQAETVSFHLGAESATIDLVGPGQLSPDDMEQAEALSCKIVWDDRPVLTRIVSPSDLADEPLRKPPTITGDVRVVQVADFDWSACGGTHTARTGEIGLIKIIKWERRGDETRVEFKCGARALADYAQKNRIVNDLAAGFSVGHWELDQAVERLSTEVKELRSHLRQAGRTLARYEAERLRASAPSLAGVRLVVRNLNEEPLMELRELARQVVSQPGVVVLLGTGDQKAQFCFARSSDVEIDMVSLVRETAAMLGSRGGGGKPDFAQGGGPLVNARQLDDALQSAAQSVRTHLERIE